VHFLFACSGIFTVGCIIEPQCTTSQTDRQTDRRQYHANSRLFCLHQYDRPKLKRPVLCLESWAGKWDSAISDFTARLSRS